MIARDDLTTTILNMEPELLDVRALGEAIKLMGQSPHKGIDGAAVFVVASALVDKADCVIEQWKDALELAKAKAGGVA